MKFTKRLWFFIIGFLIGLILVKFFFGDRACNAWTPKNRVKSAIATYNFLVSEQTLCELQNANITKDSLVNFIVQSDIDFGKSETKLNPRIYKFYHNISQMDIAVNNKDSVAYIHKLYTQKNLNCEELAVQNNQAFKLDFSK